MTSNTWLDEVARYPGVEQVAHRVHEHSPALSPVVRLLERAGVDGEAEAGAAGARVAVGLVLGLAYGLQPLGPREGVAVVTPRRGPVAPSRRVPGRLRPLDG